MGSVGHTWTCTESERVIDILSKPDYTHFRNLQGKQDTEDRLRFVSGDWVPLLVTSRFAMRKTF